MRVPSDLVCSTVSDVRFGRSRWRSMTSSMLLSSRLSRAGVFASVKVTLERLTQCRESSSSAVRHPTSEKFKGLVGFP